jgi:hypothetical protein
MGGNTLIYEIAEIDRDYRAWSGTYYKHFSTRAEAEAYCDKESWTGYDYYIREEYPDTYGHLLSKGK